MDASFTGVGKLSPLLSNQTIRANVNLDSLNEYFQFCIEISERFRIKESSINMKKRH